MTNMEDPQK